MGAGAARPLLADTASADHGFIARGSPERYRVSVPRPRSTVDSMVLS